MHKDIGKINKHLGAHWTCHTTPLWPVPQPRFDGACPSAGGRKSGVVIWQVCSSDLRPRQGLLADFSGF